MPTALRGGSTFRDPKLPTPALVDAAGAAADATAQVEFLMERLLDEQEENTKLTKRVRELEAQSQVASARQRQWPSFNFKQLLGERRRALAVVAEVERCLSDAAVRECSQFVPETMDLEVARQREERTRVIAACFRRLRGWCFVIGAREDAEDITHVVEEVTAEPQAFLKSFQFLRASCNNFNPAPDPLVFAKGLAEAEQLMVLRALQAVVVGYDHDPAGLQVKQLDALLDVAKNEEFLAKLGAVFTGQLADPLIAEELLPAPVSQVLGSNRTVTMAPPARTASASTPARQVIASNSRDSTPTPTPRPGTASTSGATAAPRRPTLALGGAGARRVTRSPTGRSRVVDPAPRGAPAPVATPRGGTATQTSRASVASSSNTPAPVQNGRSARSAPAAVSDDAAWERLVASVAKKRAPKDEVAKRLHHGGEDEEGYSGIPPEELHAPRYSRGEAPSPHHSALKRTHTPQNRDRHVQVRVDDAASGSRSTGN
jgi:hypothetical protein